MGWGRGRGGRGGRWGMGRGWGRANFAMGVYPATVNYGVPFAGEPDVGMLKSQAQRLEGALNEIRRKLAELETAQTKES